MIEGHLVDLLQVAPHVTGRNGAHNAGQRAECRIAARTIGRAAQQRPKLPANGQTQLSDAVQARLASTTLGVEDASSCFVT